MTAPAAEALPPAGRALVTAAAAGKIPPVYLVHGEPLLVGAVAGALVDVLVPAERRAFNLEVYDGRSAPLSSVLDSARMPSLLGGTKLIWVRESPALAPSERRSDTVAAICKAVAEGRMESAAARFLAVLAGAGWTQEEFDDRRLAEAPKKRLAQAFGEGLEAADLAALDELQAWVRGRGMRLAAAADAGEELLALLEAGLPRGVVLMFTAASVDSRKRLVRRIKELGAAAELEIERERSGALTAESAAGVIDRVLTAHGKKLAPEARARLMRLAGGDAGALANEVEKLCLFAGEAPVIKAEDVAATVRDLSDAWIFDLTDALAGRELRRAMLVLRGLLDAGDHPLRILATLHSQVRLLLVLRDCLDGPWKGRWHPGTRAEAFTGSLIAMLSEEEQAVLKGVHPYRLAINTGHAAKMSGGRLRRALGSLAALDLKFKSSRGDPRLLLEAFVMDMCAAPSR